MDNLLHENSARTIDWRRQQTAASRQREEVYPFDGPVDLTDRSDKEYGKDNGNTEDTV